MRLAAKTANVDLILVHTGLVRVPTFQNVGLQRAWAVVGQCNDRCRSSLYRWEERSMQTSNPSANT